MNEKRGIYTARNQVIFEGKKRNIYSMVQQITYFVQTYSSQSVKAIKCRAIGNPPCLYFPCGFFDGASNCKVTGVGYCLYLNESHRFESALGIGYGTNTKA